MSLSVARPVDACHDHRNGSRRKRSRRALATTCGVWYRMPNVALLQTELSFLLPPLSHFSLSLAARDFFAEVTVSSRRSLSLFYVAPLQTNAPYRTTNYRYLQSAVGSQ